MAITRTGTYERICTDESISIRACTTAQRAQRSAHISQRNRVNQLSSGVRLLRPRRFVTAEDLVL